MLPRTDEVTKMGQVAVDATPATVQRKPRRVAWKGMACLRDI